MLCPERNLSNDMTYDISTKYKVPDSVQEILSVACNDCHTNLTRYPWYADIMPVGWMLSNHVNDGKRHLNFSNYTKAPIAFQNHKFEETIEQLEKGEMPLPSYTYLGLHKEANLTEEQKNLIMDWARAQMAFLKETYPPDSLVMRRPGGPPPSGN